MAGATKIGPSAGGLRHTTEIAQFTPMGSAGLLPTNSRASHRLRVAKVAATCGFDVVDVMLSEIDRQSATSKGKGLRRSFGASHSGPPSCWLGAALRSLVGTFRRNKLLRCSNIDGSQNVNE